MATTRAFRPRPWCASTRRRDRRTRLTVPVPSVISRMLPRAPALANYAFWLLSVICSASPAEPKTFSTVPSAITVPSPVGSQVEVVVVPLTARLLKDPRAQTDREYSCHRLFPTQSGTPRQRAARSAGKLRVRLTKQLSRDPGQGQARLAAGDAHAVSCSTCSRQTRESSPEPLSS
jgi:hypothetical protein